VLLQWTDLAYNESAYRVFRSLSPNDSYTQIGLSLEDNTQSFIDSTANGNTQYYYKVRAVNAAGVSAYSNIASILTQNRIPAINPISNITMQINQTVNVNVTAVDDSSDVLTFTVSGLPDFASFKNKGKGKGTFYFCR